MTSASISPEAVKDDHVLLIPACRADSPVMVVTATLRRARIHHNRSGLRQSEWRDEHPYTARKRVIRRIAGRQANQAKRVRNRHALSPSNLGKCRRPLLGVMAQPPYP